MCIHTEGIGKILTSILEANFTVEANVLGLSDNNFSYDFNDTCQMSMPMIRFWARKIHKKCKQLSNFPAVTLRAFC
jgi:hypothetical protein